MAKPVIIIKSTLNLSDENKAAIKNAVIDSTNNEYYVIVVVDPSNTLQIIISNE